MGSNRRDPGPEECSNCCWTAETFQPFILRWPDPDPWKQEGSDRKGFDGFESSDLGRVLGHPWGFRRCLHVIKMGRYQGRIWHCHTLYFWESETASFGSSYGGMGNGCMIDGGEILT